MNVINCARDLLARFWPPNKNRGLVTTHQKLPGIHGLRALAARMIAPFHLHGILKLAASPAIGLIASHLVLGVNLFFVRSEFSLSYSNPNAIRDLPNYYSKRFSCFYLRNFFAWPSCAAKHLPRMASVKWTLDAGPYCGNGDLVF